MLAESGPSDREAWARTILAGLLPHFEASLVGSLAEVTRAVEIARDGGFRPAARGRRHPPRSTVRRSPHTRGAPAHARNPGPHRRRTPRHASPVTTMRVYAHVLPKSDVQAAELVGALLAR